MVRAVVGVQRTDPTAKVTALEAVVHVVTVPVAGRHGGRCGGRTAERVRFRFDLPEGSLVAARIVLGVSERTMVRWCIRTTATGPTIVVAR